MKNLLKISLIGIVILSMTGCIKDDVVINTDEITKIDRPLYLTGPVAKARFTADDIIGRLDDDAKDNISVDEDGLIIVTYRDSIYSDWDDIAKVDELVWNRNLSLLSVDPQVINGVGVVTYSGTFTQKFNLNSETDQRFDSIFIRTANLALSLNFPAGSTGSASIEFPELVKDGSSLTATYNVASSDSIKEDLAGYKLYCSHNAEKDSSYFTMVVNFDITMDSASPLTPAIDFNLTLRDLYPEFVFGYFGQMLAIDEVGVLDFSFFDDLNRPELIEFFDINVVSEFNNYYGVPFIGKIEDVFMINEAGQNAELSFLANVPDSNTVYVDPAEYENGVVTPIQNAITIDRTNSNINDAVNIFPNKIDYRVTASLNPYHNYDFNFVSANNRIEGDLFLNIPLWLRTKNYYRTDTISDFDAIAELEDETIDMLDSVSFEFEFSNWFPFDMDAQVYLADSNYVIIDSLWQEDKHFLEAGVPVVDGGNVVDPTVSRSEVLFSQDQIRKYKESNVRSLLIYSRARTSEEGEPFVKIFDSYGLGLNLSMSLVSDEIEISE